MKQETEEPFVAVFFKGLAIIGVLIAIYLAVAQGFPGLIMGLYLVLGAAPCAWWMGAILALLDRIAKNGERPSPQAPGKVAQGGQGAKGKSGSILGRGDDDMSTPPKYEL